MSYPNQLAWHETLDLHELVAFQANGLIKLKKSVRNVPDQALQSLYIKAINVIQNNLQELVQFYPYAPGFQSQQHRDDTGFYAGDLLGLAKTSVRNYAIAVTETATPRLREVLTRQINGAIQLHAQVFNFMYERGYYPAYDLKQLLKNDIQNVQKAIQMQY
ncbi:MULTISPECIES: spore coat protein CotF [Bacillus cereus group]|uniref:Spore coat protein F n=1 Tax=Bacillus paranthracis TaxID=2026186 RepID=A0A9X8SPW4_9BACI|nr:MULTISPECIES: spore coat protein CotF [Bacillus cereus group]MDA1989644.1 spore coat protein CotF [Bacillus cereus group sp. BcHK104]MDX6044356.1 spore coat protein CotF [Bacillus paranthracis]ONG78093.1 spore coat protein [Bacillus cereus]SME48071.1 Spore coat protein F precursor [Bacillus paranthracis]